MGSRIAQVRIRRGKTQAELGVEVGLSPNYLSKLERGDRDGLTVETLLAMADALGVVVKFEAEEDDVREQDRKLILPLRRLLLPVVRVGVPVDEEDLTLARLRERVAKSTADFNRARYAKLATEIPTIITSIETAIGRHENEAKADLYRLLAHAYILTAQTLVWLRSEDLAYQAIRNAMEAAENAGDPILRASAVYNLSWVFIRQGMYDDAEAVAVRMADEIEPSMSNATSRHLATWGRLLKEASIAAAYANRPDTADELLSIAHGAAVRIDGRGMDYEKYWSVFNPAVIGITKTENTFVGGDAELTLRIGREVRRTENLHLDMWTLHLLIIANSQTSTRDYAGAIETMKSIRSLAPEWIKNSRGAHDVAIKLLDASTPRRAKSSGLAELAAFMEVKP